MTWRNAWARLAAVTVVALAASSSAHASLARNPAGAKNMGEAGAFAMDVAGEFATAPDGKGAAFEVGLQFQMTNRVQLLVESIPVEWQRPEGGGSTSGMGDTDVALSWLALGAGELMPSLVLGAKVKIPTARKEVIGTGKVDYSALLILGQEFGELELSLETEFARFGQPGGEELKDQFIYSAIAEVSIGDYLAVYAEAFGNSAPTALEARTDAARAGLEIDVPVSESVAPYLSFEVDTEEVFGARAGVEWTW